MIRDAGRRTRACRALAAIVTVSLTLCVALPARGQPAVAPASPKVYALVAAMGDEFTFASGDDRPPIGSHVPNRKRIASRVDGNVLNRMALHSLDAAIGKIDSGSERIYLSLEPAAMEAVPPARRESASIARVVAELANLPERQKWDRIVVATPAYRALDADGMAGKMQGFGLYTEQRCQACGGVREDVNSFAAEPPGGAVALTSEDETIRAGRFSRHSRTSKSGFSIRRRSP